MALRSVNVKKQSIIDAYDQVVMNIYMDKLKNGHKSFAVCGCSQKAGTTTVSRKVAAYFAKTGWKTLLIDMDFHKRNRTFEEERQEKIPTLTDYIGGNIPVDKIVQDSIYENLFIIESGQINGGSVAELLCSVKLDQLILDLFSEYDFIFFDTPSLVAYPDSKIICTKTDAVLLVAAFGETSKKALENIKKQLDAVHASVVGIIITKEKQGKRKRKGNRHEF